MIASGFIAACDGNVSGDLSAESFGDLSNPSAERRDGYAEMATACEQQTPPPIATTPLRRKPYLQQVTETSAQLLWTSRSKTAGTVVVRETTGVVVAEVTAIPDAAVPVQSGFQQYVAAIGYLEPATTYCYEVRAGEDLWERAAFRTAPALGSEDAVRFVAFGDSGSGDSDQRAALEQMRTVPFDLMIHTGDLAYDDGTRGEVETRVFDIYADVFKAFPFFPTSGNHDQYTEGGAPFLEAFSLPANGGPDGVERWYSFDWGNVHFVALDTQRTGPLQAAWLEADLTANRQPWTIVYLHKPPFSSGHHGNEMGVRQYFNPIFERHHVPVVLSGHDHHYERTHAMNGVTYILTGGGGRGTREAGYSSFTAFSEAVIHFVYVEISGDTLLLHAIDGRGQEFDSLRVVHPRPRV